MDFNGNVYYQPESWGLETVTDLDDPNADYSFDILAVWREPATGRVFWASDAGCSCPSPFEDFRSLEDLNELTAETWDAFEAAVQIHCVWDLKDWNVGEFGCAKVELLRKVSPLVPMVKVDEESLTAAVEGMSKILLDETAGA